MPFWKYLGATLLIGPAIVIGLVLLVLPGIVFALMFMFAIVHRDRSRILSKLSDEGERAHHARLQMFAA